MNGRLRADSKRLVQELNLFGCYHLKILAYLVVASSCFDFFYKLHGPFNRVVVRYQVAVAPGIHLNWIENILTADRAQAHEQLEFDVCNQIHDLRIPGFGFIFIISPVVDSAIAIVATKTLGFPVIVADTKIPATNTVNDTAPAAGVWQICKHIIGIARCAAPALKKLIALGIALPV